MESINESQQNVELTSTAEGDEQSYTIPFQCISDRSMMEEFKLMVKNTADDINDIFKLTYMCNMNQTSSKGEDFSALDVFRKLEQKGYFAYNNIGPLEQLLVNIDRCDLVTKHIDPYKQTYGEHATSRSSVRSFSPSSMRTRTLSVHSLPPQAIPRTSSYPTQRKKSPVTPEETKPRAHTDPASPSSLTSSDRRPSTEARHPHRCTALPEEESCSLGSPVSQSGQPLPLKEATMLSSGSMQAIRYSLQVPLRQKRENTSRCLSPSTVVGEECIRAVSPLPMRYSPSTPLRQYRQSNTLWMNNHEDVQHHIGRMHLGSNSSKASMSTSPMSEQWSAASIDPDTFDTESEASFSCSELEHNGAIGLNQPYANNVSYSHHHYDDAHSMCSYQPHPSQCHNYNKHSVNPVHCSLPTLIPSDRAGSQYDRRRPDCVSLFDVPCQRGGVDLENIRSTKGSRTNTKNHTWQISRESLLNGMKKLGEPLKDRVNFILPVGCKRKKDPKISLNVMPCQNEQSRHVDIAGELNIPRGCSRHKWFVEYCSCSVKVTVKVINPKDQRELGCSFGNFDIVHNGMNCDHRTYIRLVDVLAHQDFLYDDNMDKLHFHASVRLSEHKVREDQTVQQYECKEAACDDDFTEIFLPFSPSQASNQ